MCWRPRFYANLTSEIFNPECTVITNKAFCDKINVIVINVYIADLLCYFFVYSTRRTSIQIVFQTMAILPMFLDIQFLRQSVLFQNDCDSFYIFKFFTM